MAETAAPIVYQLRVVLARNSPALSRLLGRTLWGTLDGAAVSPATTQPTLLPTSTWCRSPARELNNSVAQRGGAVNQRANCS